MKLTSMNLSQVYVKILRWGIFVSLFLPLVIFSQYLSPFHFGKMVVFRTLVEIMAVFYILLILVDARYRPKWTYLLITFSIFTGLYILTAIIGVNFYRSLWGTLERMGGIFSFLHFWVYFIILTSIIRIKEDWQRIFKISVFVGFLSILFAYGQRLQLGKFFVGWQHGERVIGTIGNPALFAGYLLFIFYLALLFLLKKKTPTKEKGFFVSVLIFGVPVLLMTAVRGAILSFFGSLFLLALFFIFTSKKKVRIYLLIAVVIFSVLATGAWLSREESWVKSISWLDRLTSISMSTATVQTRLWSWNSAIQAWKEKPVFGWGPENFSVLHMKYFDPRHFTHIGSETIWDRAHNVLLNALATMGVIGLLSYLSIFGVIFYILIKKFKRKKLGRVSFGVLSVMLIAYLGQNLFIFDTFANYFMFFLVLGYINHLSLKKPSFAKATEGKEERRPSIFLIAILLVLAIILAYQTNIKPAQANFACTRAILAGGGGNAQEALDKYQEALNYQSPQGSYEIRHKLATFLIRFTENQRQKNKDFDPSLLYYAIKGVGKNIEKYPLDTIPYLYVGRMYILLIHKEPEIAGEQAEMSIRKALELNRNNPRIWYELGQAQLSQGKNQESYQSFKKAAELNPRVAISWWFLGVTAYQVENYKEAVENIEKAIELGYNAYKNSISDLMRLVNIYEKVGNYQKVIEFYKLAIEERPEDAQLYASLAATYARMGSYDKAVETALKAAEIDPQFRDEAEKFIESLGK
jgi:tetratricopeptide (TPR) repeat protein